MQKIAKLNFVYDIRAVSNIFVSYFGCSKMNQKKYVFARTSEPWLLVNSWSLPVGVSLFYLLLVYSFIFDICIPLYLFYFNLI
jgi:hypothetical protein